MTHPDLNADTILDATLATLLRSTVDPHTDVPLVEDFGPDDVASETRESLREEIADFLDEHADDLREALNSRTGYTQAHIGQDIALTRNHHGAGFWDRGLNGVGTRLTEAAHNLGSLELYPTTDGALRD